MPKTKYYNMAAWWIPGKWAMCLYCGLKTVAGTPMATHLVTTHWGQDAAK